MMNIFFIFFDASSTHLKKETNYHSNFIIFQNSQRPMQKFFDWLFILNYQADLSSLDLSLDLPLRNNLELFRASFSCMIDIFHPTIFLNIYQSKISPSCFLGLSISFFLNF